MKTLVIDSSVITKWVNQSNEQNVEDADNILNKTFLYEVELIAPELAKYELGNVLLKGKQLTLAEARITLNTLYSLPITFITESEELAKETYAIALDTNITYYDASFISLAKQYNATLVTDNMKHQGKVKDINVVSLKDYKQFMSSYS